MIVSMNRTRATRRAAFTLMEVLVVVAIVVILASVGTLATMKFLDEAKINAARAKAQNLVQYAKTYQTSNDGRWPEDINELAQYAEGGQRALIDPWEKQFIMTLKNDSATGQERIFIYTIEGFAGKETGKVVGAPRELEGQ